MKALLVLLFLGAAIYVVIRLMQGGSGRTVRRRPPTGPPQRPIAPDDDPDFLRDLDRRRRDEDSS